MRRENVESCCGYVRRKTAALIVALGLVPDHGRDCKAQDCKAGVTEAQGCLRENTGDGP